MCLTYLSLKMVIRIVYPNQKCPLMLTMGYTILSKTEWRLKDIQF